MTPIILALFSALLFVSNANAYRFIEFYFNQKVDHFGFANDDYFLQRYLVNVDYYDPHNGTIFFYTGNEGDIEMFANNTGFMWENAPAFNATLIFAEHRYYGKSLPYGKDSFKKKEYTGYLTSEQALADFAFLLEHVIASLAGAEKAPFIAFGGSYGGMLAAWMRIKYPHLIDGAVASSAPILQFGEGAPCGRFAEIVTQDFQDNGDSCPKAIRNSWSIIRKYTTTDAGLRFLTDTFKLCKQLTCNDADQFVNWLMGTWSYLAMTDYPYPTSFLNPLPANPISVVCSFLKNHTEPAQALIKDIAKAANVFHNYTGNVQCNDLNNSGGAALGEQGWDYQACTEMVGPQCYTGVTDMFEPIPWNFTAYTETCMKNWNVRPIANMSFTIYGGANITASSNIVFSNGKLDPWYGYGFLESLSDTIIAVVIENSAHHLDLRSSNPADPDSVVNARETIKNQMWRWVLERRRR